MPIKPESEAAERVEREVAFIATRMRALKQYTPERSVYECYCIVAAEWANSCNIKLSNTYKAFPRAY
jgi:hypothetical protein